MLVLVLVCGGGNDGWLQDHIRMMQESTVFHQLTCESQEDASYARVKARESAMKQSTCLLWPNKSRRESMR